MNESITLILPLPSKLLSQNRPVFTRGGRIAQAAAVKAYKQAARDACGAEGIQTGPWSKAMAQDVFYWPTKRNRDVRNAEAMLKPVYDGIVEAGLLADDNADVLTHHPSIFKVDKENPRVEVTITRVECVGSPYSKGVSL